MASHLFPVSAAWCCRHGRAHEAKLLGFVVGAEVEEAVAMVDVILLVVDALGDDRGARPRALRGVEEAAPRWCVAAAFDEQVLAVAGAAYGDVEALVRLVKIASRACSPSGEPERRVLAFGLLVFGGVEQRCGVCCPHQRADPRGCIRQQFARVEIEHVQRVLAEAGVVRRIRELALPSGLTEMSPIDRKGWPSASYVDIQQHLLGVRQAWRGGADRWRTGGLSRCVSSKSSRHRGRELTCRLP